MTNSTHDRWLLPRRQTEYPGRDLLPEETVHGRREATFLVLTALFFVATATLLVLGTSRVVDPTTLLARVAPSVELPTALLVPLAVIPFAVSFIAAAMTHDLFGRKRASALVWMGLVACFALVALMRGADLVDGGSAFAIALAFTAYYLVAHGFHLLGCAAFGRRSFFVRVNAAALLAQLAGWSVAGLVLHAAGGFLIEPMASSQIVALTAGAAAASMLCVFVLAIPAAIATRALSVALRVGWFDDEDEALQEDDAWRGEPVHLAETTGFAEGSVARKLPAALIVDDDEVVPLEQRHRRPRASLQPFSSAEMRFFSEGDAAHD